MRYALAFVPHLRAQPLFQPLFADTPFPSVIRGEYVDLTQFGHGIAQVQGTMTSFGKDPSGTPLCAVTVAIAAANQAAMPFAAGDFVPWPWFTDATQEVGGHDIGNG
ncbi:hypothetical protein MCBMB27_00920 [Methylobacterium phyllosphaerae]|nr:MULTISPECIES: hypothetical protein [Methylobacterium]AIQ89339.1 protein of unassigned function [Methylobacterium oryzae CBMB20]APT30211.1 hypothetical protein MCBMB27_00920 [Methylobacterium phyllosphaerae]SFH76257.1 hypothetical protein SAMN05192567_1588 [Methylobacterium phyllosphaerae]